MIDAHILRGRAGQPVVISTAPSTGNTAPQAARRMNGRIVDVDKLYERLVRGTSMEAIAAHDMNRLAQPETNG